MEDRFKFRVWCKNKKEWEKNDPFMRSDGTLHCWHPSHLKPYSLDTHIVSWCTGLKDKNGVLVYEGDLLEDETGVGEVKWLMENCKFVVRTIKPHHEYHNLESDGQLKKTEIIGTIHTHPELLEYT